MSRRRHKEDRPLTAEMERALELVAQHGCLVRYGFGWQRPNAPLKKKWFTRMRYYHQGIPEELVHTATVKRLLELELLQPAPGYEALPDCPLPPRLILSPPLTPTP